MFTTYENYIAVGWTVCAPIPDKQRNIHLYIMYRLYIIIIIIVTTIIIITIIIIIITWRIRDIRENLVYAIPLVLLYSSLICANFQEKLT